MNSSTPQRGQDRDERAFHPVASPSLLPRDLRVSPGRLPQGQCRLRAHYFAAHLSHADRTDLQRVIETVRALVRPTADEQAHVRPRRRRAGPVFPLSPAPTGDLPDQAGFTRPHLLQAGAHGKGISSLPYLQISHDGT